MNFPKITATFASVAKNNLDTILFAILVIALGFYVSHLSQKVDEAKTYKAMQQKLIHDYEVEQKYLEDNKASILKEMQTAQDKQDALYQEYLKNKKANEDKLQNADSRLQDLDGCIRLVSFECVLQPSSESQGRDESGTNTNKNASGGASFNSPASNKGVASRAVSTVPGFKLQQSSESHRRDESDKYSLIPTAYADSDTNNKPAVQSGSNHTYSPTTQSSVGKDTGKRYGSAGKLQTVSQAPKTPPSPLKNDCPIRPDCGTHWIDKSKEHPLVKQSSARSLSLEMIRKYEGLRLTAYWDSVGPAPAVQGVPQMGRVGYSIGYGSRSYQGETITKKEAERRLQVIVDALITRIQKDYPKSSENKIAALTSLRYNCERCYKRITAKVRKGEPKIEYWKNGAGGRQLKGLLKRREEEVRLFLNT